MTRACGIAVLAATLVAAVARAQDPPPDAGAAPLRVDVAIAIDVSSSTQAASGIDVDGDGVIGINPQLDARLDGQYPRDLYSTDPGDTVLEAELAAVRALLETLRGADARIAILAFSGAVDPETHQQLGSPDDNARLVAPLAADLDAAFAALDEIAERGPWGGTDFSAAIRTARAALCGADPRPGADRVLLLLTDGVPSLPFGYATRTDPSDVSAAITAAREAQACGVRTDVFAIGFAALADPHAAKEVARVTGGVYRPIRAAGALRAALERALLAEPAPPARR